MYTVSEKKKSLARKGLIAAVVVAFPGDAYRLINRQAPARLVRHRGWHRVCTWLAWTDSRDGNSPRLLVDCTLLQIDRERERERARVHATSLDASNRTFHFCNLKEVDRPVSSASLPRPPSAFDPFCSLPRVALSRRCAAPRSLLETSVEGYLAPYTVIFRFTMIPANAFVSWLLEICVTRNFQRCILLIELWVFMQIYFPTTYISRVSLEHFS